MLSSQPPGATCPSSDALVTSGKLRLDVGSPAAQGPSRFLLLNYMYFVIRGRANTASLWNFHPGHLAIWPVRDVWVSRCVMELPSGVGRALR